MPKVPRVGTRLLSLWSQIRSSYWFVPSIMLLGAVLLSFLMIFIDEVVDHGWIRDLTWFYANEPSGARELLSTVAGSMITVAGVTFSITIVALTLASSQFGPQVLRNFMRDPGNQIVLGTFIATFMYCLLILRTVRDAEDTIFVPHLSIVLALILAVTSLGVLIYFIHHTASSIQAANLVAKIGGELERVIDQLYPERPYFPERLGREPPQEEPRLPEGFHESARVVRATEDGYLQAVDKDGLMALAKEHDLILYLEHRPGDFVRQRGRLVKVWPSQHTDDALLEELAGEFTLASYRSQDQDLAFLFEQLVQMALRALSTGIDDPLTAVLCIDRIGAALCHLAERETPSPYRHDDSGKLRVVAFPLTFAEAVKQTLAPIRRHGGDEFMVLLRLLKTIALIAECASQEDRRVLLEEAMLIRNSAQKHIEEEADRKEMEEAYRHAVAALDIKAPV